MDIVDTIQSPLIATTCYKRKDNLGINVLDTKDGPPGCVGAIRDGQPASVWSVDLNTLDTK